jgi:glutathione S-transferase
MAIACAGLTVELREVLLRTKPETMLEISPKGTVPVLQLAGGQVIDESIEIMRWALSFSDPDGWLEASAGCEGDTAELVVWNDGGFKHYLDRYKYADRFPENDRDFYRGLAEPFLLELECRLSSNFYLCGSRLSFTDVAIFPFVRQFAGVDRVWFDGSRYRAVRTWLQGLIDSPLFECVMQTYPLWSPASFRTLMGIKQEPETPRAS